MTAISYSASMFPRNIMWQICSQRRWIRQHLLAIATVSCFTVHTNSVSFQSQGEEARSRISPWMTTQGVSSYLSPPGCEGLKLVLSSEQYLDLPGHLSQSLRVTMTCLDNDGQLGQRTLKAISVDREAEFQLSRVHASLHLPLRCVFTYY